MRRALLLFVPVVSLASSLLVAAPTGCFKPSLPVVAFSCGDGGICPRGYECRTDGCCHKIGSSPDEHGACTLPSDAGLDTGVDAALHDCSVPMDASVVADAATSQDASP